MKRFLTFSILFTILLFLPRFTFANHIAGGEINVKWISGNTYEVSVKVWRDCTSGTSFDPEWPITNPFSRSIEGGNICNVNIFSRPWTDGRYLGDTVGIVLGIYDKVTRAMKDSLYMHLNKITRINPPLGYCYKNPAICIEEGLYIGTVDLSNNPNGYILAWQRCCRNTGLTNIDNPAIKTSPANQGSQNAGFVLYTEVADPSIHNSSPVSIDYPSFVLCSNNPNIINSFKASDVDGDSLVYSIVAPLNGYSIPGVYGTPNSSGQLWGFGTSGCDASKGAFLAGILDRPSPIFPPVLWRGTYSAFNVFGGAPATTIDSKTGIITTGTGMLLGNYAIAVKVEEYRNGVKIGEIRRDAQFSMVNCAAVNVTIDVMGQVDCFGGSNGSATVSGSSSNGGPYAYKWTPNNSTTNVATGLIAGTYSVTVTDNNGCLTTLPVVVTQPTEVMPNINPSITHIKCFGSNTGSATANPSGGTGSYTYSWSTSTPQTTQTATGLSFGTYTLKVADSKGCTNKQTVTLTQPAAVLSCTASVVNSVNCFGGNNGSAMVTSSGGTPNYTYLWQPGGQATSSISGLSAGDYTVTIMDANGCTTNQSVAITQPSASLSTSATATTNVNCFGNGTGSATANPSGGTPNYTYSWSTGTPQSTQTATGLNSGTYTVKVTDSKGCTVNQTVTITQPSASLTSTASVIANVNCFGNGTGSATANPSGGTPNYTYSWSTGTPQSTQTATGLSSGTYTVKVTDSRGCTTNQTVSITQPPSALTMTASASSNVNCYGGNTGVATSAPSGGTMNYTYAWLPGGQTAASISNLTAGTYTVTVTDAQGCTNRQTVTLTQPSAALTSTVTAGGSVSCFGGNNGTATASPTGGTPNYTYFWQPGGQGTSSISGLSAGGYTVTITDAQGCTNRQTVTITQPPGGLVVTTNPVKSVNCYGGNNGTATASPTGGTPNYTYSWLPGGETTQGISNLSSGSYTVTVTDAGGCSNQQIVAITQPNASLTTAVSATSNVNCFGGNTGTATATTSGGTPNYAYSWLPGGQTISSISNLISGTYTVSVTDAQGCTNLQTVTITQPNASLTTAVSATSNVNCFGGNNGIATATTSGGTPNYTYTWLPGGESTPGISNLMSGTYTVSVTDSQGCTNLQTVSITQPNVPLTATVTATTNVNCLGGNNGSVSANPVGGTPAYTYTWLAGGQTTKDITNLAAGTYTVLITDAKGCTNLQTASISEPNTAIDVRSISTPASCYNNDGTISVIATGGTPNYTYQWNPNVSAGASVSNLGAGTWTVTVTDEQGCTKTIVSTVTKPPGVTAGFVFNPASGFAPLSVSFTNLSVGGTRYDWHFGGTDDIAIQDTILNPSHTYKDTGTFNVRLITYNSYGCADTMYAYIRVNPKSVLCIPNVFSPNGDGKNDVWKLCQDGNMELLEVVIYDRWGLLIYQWDTPEGGWDGRSTAGREVPEGTYYYVIRARGTDQVDYGTTAGYLTLLRQ